MGPGVTEGAPPGYRTQRTGREGPSSPEPSLLSQRASGDRIVEAREMRTGELVPWQDRVLGESGALAIRSTKPGGPQH